MLARASGPDGQPLRLEGLEQLAWTMVMQRRRRIMPDDEKALGAGTLQALEREGLRIVRPIGPEHEFRHDQMRAFLARVRTCGSCHENSFSADVGSCGLGLWFEGDVVAEALDTSFEVGDGSGPGDLVEVGFSEFAVGRALGEHVIGSHEDFFVSDGESGAQWPLRALRRWNLSLR